MKILAVGDIVGEAGVKKLKEILPQIKNRENVDFVITNGENSAGGMGITEKNFKDIIDAGTNVVTMGNHTWGKRDIFKFIDDPKILRPANYPKGVVGKGVGIYNCNNKKIAVLNLMGRVDINILTENPFILAKEKIKELEEQVDIIIMDFHAEATAEKIAMARFLDGSITIVFGTHTHVQTADEQIFPKGTAYITDLGMTGPKESVIGMDIQASIKRFETALPEKYKIAEGECIFNSIMFEIDDVTNKVTSIKRINF
ncbi:MAG: TIGR00282 family metallophosphoesterase [Clostridia bacterium]|nr:TIGR00282 family metallophosphoesterase [Clostridia bacterium]